MVRMCWKFFSLSMSALAFTTLVACMPKVEEDEVVPVVSIASSAINGSATEPYITIIGACPIGTYNLQMMVNSTEYSLSENSTKVMVANSGVPVGQCKGGSFSVNYPVPNPGLARPMTFKFKAKLTDGRSSLEWAIRTINYTQPAASGLSGFVIASVGATLNSGILTASGIMMHSVGGEVAGNTLTPGNILTSSQAIMRSGLHGVVTGD